jgi:hypothetical protein
VGCATPHLFVAALGGDEVVEQCPKLAARAGWRFYQKLFDGDAQCKALGDHLRRLAHMHQLKIQICSRRFLLPWGLLYLADRYDPDHIDPELFLGLKHIIESIPIQSDPRAVDTLTIDSRPTLTVGVNVNADIDREMGLPLIKEQLAYWAMIKQRSGAKIVVRKARDKVQDALADRRTADQILYFYCHAVSRSLSDVGGPDTSCLVFSNGQRLTLNDLLRASRRQAPRHPACLHQRLRVG